MQATTKATMALHSDQNSKDTRTTVDTTMDDDDETVIAETTTTKTDFIKAEMKDLHIRYDIPFNKASQLTMTSNSTLNCSSLSPRPLTSPPFGSTITKTTG